MSETLSASLAPGTVHLLGYTTLVQSPRDRVYYQSPDGARILVVPMVGEALLPNSPQIRRLLEPIVVDSEVDGRERLDAIVDQVLQPDPVGRRLVLAELVLWPELSDRLTAADADSLRAAFDADAPEQLVQEYILAVLRRQSGRFGSDWLARASRQVLDFYGPEVDLRTQAPSLVSEALAVLGKVGSRADASLAKKYFGSNNPTVERVAMEVFIELDPGLAARELPMLLWDGAVGEDARGVGFRFLMQQGGADAG